MFGKRLKEARIKAGYESAQQFAYALGIKPATYRFYERGQSQPNFKVLTRICELLHIGPQDLLPEADHKRHQDLTADLEDEGDADDFGPGYVPVSRPAKTKDAQAAQKAPTGGKPATGLGTTGEPDSGVSGAHKASEFDWGKPVGDEVW